MNPPKQLPTPPTPAKGKESAAKEPALGDWVDSVLLPPELHKALQDPSSKIAMKQPASTSWLDALLLPSQKPVQTDKCIVSKDKDNSSPPAVDAFCSIPELMKINFCCAETVATTKGADDQSHSTINSEDNLQEGEQTLPAVDAGAAVTEPTTSTSFQAWEKFFADLNNNICGNATVDGLPPTIDIASPINNGSSLLVIAEDKSRRTEEGNDKAPEDAIAAKSSIIDGCQEEEEQEGQETIANETIVIYYTDSGSTDGNNEQAPASTATVQTVVRVALDPSKQPDDDAILQDRARVESDTQEEAPSASVANLEAESTAAIVASPIKFQNLATGSFCEIASDCGGVEETKDEPSAANKDEDDDELCKTTSVQKPKPLLEEEEVADEDKVLKPLVEEREEEVAGEDEEKKGETEEEESLIRFQNLATGSFCEITPGCAGVKEAKEEPSAANNEDEFKTSSGEELKPLVEEEVADKDKELKRMVEKEELADDEETKKETEEEESPVRFQNLATGSFCAIVSDSTGAEGAKDGPSGEEEPMPEEHQVAVEEQAVEEEQEHIGEEHPTPEEDEEPVAGAEQVVVAEEDEEEAEAEEEDDLKVVAVVDVEPEEEEEDDDWQQAAEETADVESSNPLVVIKKLQAPIVSLYDDTLDDDSEQGSVEAVATTLEVESSGNTVKLVSLFVGVFDSLESPELH